MLEANQQEAIELGVVDGYRVTGSVLEEGTKTPIEGAYVRVSPSPRWPVQLSSFCHS